MRGRSVRQRGVSRNVIRARKVLVWEAIWPLQPGLSWSLRLTYLWRELTPVTSRGRKVKVRVDDLTVLGPQYRRPFRRGCTEHLFDAHNLLQGVTLLRLSSATHPLLHSGPAGPHINTTAQCTRPFLRRGACKRPATVWIYFLYIQESVFKESGTSG